MRNPVLPAGGQPSAALRGALIQALHDQNPELLIIGIRGALKTSMQKATEKLPIVEFLQKPITPAWKPVVERIRARSPRAS